MIYREIDKMSDLLSHDWQAIQTVSWFGIPMGVGDKSIQAVCEEHGIHTPTFLAIVNHSVSGTGYYGRPCERPAVQTTDIDLPTLRTYLKNAHTYFLEFHLPRLRRQLIEAINPTATSSQIPLLIVRYFDDYVGEIRIHMQHEDEGLLEEHASDDKNMTQKLHELVDLIIKYYPANTSYPFANELMAKVLLELYHTEYELQAHCAIEDEILRPAIQRQKKKKMAMEQAIPQEGLSEREIEVLKLVAEGLMNKEIADRLHLSLHTVVTHRKNIARKLNIHSTAGLTIYAIVNKLVEI